MKYLLRKRPTVKGTVDVTGVAHKGSTTQNPFVYFYWQMLQVYSFLIPIIKIKVGSWRFQLQFFIDLIFLHVIVMLFSAGMYMKKTCIETYQNSSKIYSGLSNIYKMWCQCLYLNHKYHKINIFTIQQSESTQAFCPIKIYRYRLTKRREQFLKCLIPRCF